MRVFTMKTAFLTILFELVTLAGMPGCARRPIFPDQHSVPPAAAAPLDGTWRLMSGKANSIFRIEKGRMYYVDRRKPSRANLVYARQVSKASRSRSAAELSNRPGGIVVKNIRETGDPLKYSCQSASFGAKTNTVGFGRCEIKIVSATEILLRTLPNSQTGLNEVLEDRYWRETLDDQSWFEKTVRADDHREVTSGEEIERKAERKGRPQDRSGNIEREVADDSVQVRKVLIVPLERMEADGKLSKYAKAFIHQAVQSATSSRGAVEIRYPSNAPDSVVESLIDLGVKTFLDEHRDDYELVIIKRDTR